MSFSFGAAAPAATTAAATTTAAPATTTAFTTAPAATAASVVPSSVPASSLSSTWLDYSSLLRCVQDAWNRAGQVEELRQQLQANFNNIMLIQEQHPSATARAAIESKNVEMDGVKLNLSDERTVKYILDVSDLLHLNELDSLRLVFQSAQSLTRSNPNFAQGSSASDVQNQIKDRAIELYYKRRFNLLTALLDLILMDRSGSTQLNDEDPVGRLVTEAVTVLSAKGLATAVMNALERLYATLHPPPPPPTLPGLAPPPPIVLPKLLPSYRVTEISFLIRILFALFQSHTPAPHDIPGEEIERLVVLLQARSADLTVAANKQLEAQKAAAQAQKALATAQFGFANNQPVANINPNQPIPSGPEPIHQFNCYALLCCLMSALECKYQSLASSLSLREKEKAVGNDRTISASQANADADLAQFLRSLSSKISLVSNWNHDIFRCGTLLTWALFLRRVRSIAPGTDFAEEEIQGLVLEGLGGNENTGFWIHLNEQIQENPSFADLRKGDNNSFVFAPPTPSTITNPAAPATNGAAAGTTAPLAATPAVAEIPSNAHAASTSSVSSEMSEILGEFLCHCLVFHSKEMDLLRREDKKTDRAYQKQVTRHQLLVQAQQQQAHMYQLQHGYAASSGNNAQPNYLGGSTTNPTGPTVPELAPPPKLNFAAFLSILSTIVQSTPPLVQLLWAQDEFRAFLAKELFDNNSLQLEDSRLLQNGGFGLSSAAAAAAATMSSSSSQDLFTNDSPFLLSYLDLLAALCVDETCALLVHDFVQQCKLFDTLIVELIDKKVIQNYLPQLQNAQSDAMYGRGRGGLLFGQSPYQGGFGRPQQAAHVVQPLSTRDLDLLSSALSLLASVARPAAGMQNYFVSGDFALLDKCFSLLSVPVLGVHLKAKVLVCISALVRLNPTQASLGWEKLEQSQILPTVNYATQLLTSGSSSSQLQRSKMLQQSSQDNTVNAASGLLFNLEEIESNLRTYPLTGALLELIFTLFESAPLPKQLGVNVRNPTASNNNSQQGYQSHNGIMSHHHNMISDESHIHPALYGPNPYSAFMFNRVFLNLPHRSYANALEQFGLTETCLATFNALIQDWLSELAGCDGVRVECEIGSTFRARHQSHVFLNPQGTIVPGAPIASDSDENGAVGNEASTPPAVARASWNQKVIESLAVHPAYALLRDLLSGKEICQQILNAFTVSFSMLDNEIAVSGSDQAQVLPSSVEGTLLLILKLFFSILEKEDDIISALQHIEAKNGQQMATLRFDCSYLSSLLMQNQASILTLGKAVGYIQTHSATAVQKLIREKMERFHKNQARATFNASAGGAADMNATAMNFHASFANSTFAGYDANATGSAESDAFAAADAAAAAVAGSEESLSTEIAFYASSSLLALSIRDGARLVHIFEANQMSPQMISSFQRQIKNVMLPLENAASEIQDPDLICNKSRAVIMDLLLSSLENSSPATPHISLALLLLGFDIVSQAAVQQTDLLRSPRRELFDTLFFDLSLKAGFAQHFPTLSQSVFQLLYRLLSHPLTSAPTIRALKTHPAGEGSVALYLTRAVRSLPIVSDVPFLIRLMSNAEENVNMTTNVSAEPTIISSTGASSLVHQTMFQLSWLLKSLNLHYFITVGVAARTRHSNNADEAFLVDEEIERYLIDLGYGENGVEGDDDHENSPHLHKDWLSTTTTSLAAARGFDAASSNLRAGVRVLDILANLHAYLRSILPPTLVVESPTSKLSGAPAANTDEQAVKYFDRFQNAFQYSLLDVYRLLIQKHAFSPSSAFVEANKCLKWNIVTAVLGSAKHAFESWKQNIEVVLLNSSEVLIRKNPQRFESILLQLLHTLLQKLVSKEDTANNVNGNESSALSIWVALSEELSSLSLTVISKLRDVLHLTSTAPQFEAAGSTLATAPRSSQLHTILTLLVSAILNTRHAASRINLYAIFLNYILYSKERNEYIEKHMSPNSGDDQDANQQASYSKWFAIQQEQLRLDSQNLSLLSSHNLPLLTLVVSDALDGSSKLRSVAFRFLNMMLLGSSAHSNLKVAARSVKETNSYSGGLKYFAGKAESVSQVLPSNYSASCLSIFQKNNLLLLFLNQLKSNDELIQQAIEESGIHALDHYDVLLNLECCLSFILQLAMTPEGAKMLVEYQVVGVIASLQFLRSRPAPSHGSAYAGMDMNDGISAAASTTLTPFEKFQSAYLLVLQLLVQLLQSLPSHQTLVSSVQRFLNTAHHDTLASIVKDSSHHVTSLSLQSLSTTLSLLYQMLREESAAAVADASRLQERQPKIQRVGPGFSKFGGMASTATDEDDPSPSYSPALAFTAFVTKHQPFILQLLARYSRPQSSPRLRAYLAQVRRLQQSKQASQGRLDPLLELMLEQGEEHMQAILKKTFALLVTLIAPTSDATEDELNNIRLFGPHLGDGGVDDTAFGTEETLDAHQPAHPQLELLLAILQENVMRLQSSHRELFTLRKNLEQLSAVSSGDANASASGNGSLYPDLGGGSANGGISSSSAVALLESNYFPPSSSAFFYEEFDAVQRARFLSNKLQEHVKVHNEQVTKYLWNIEHVLMLLHHHVRLELRQSQQRMASSASGNSFYRGSIGGALAPREFRAQAENILMPMLTQVIQTVGNASNTAAANNARNGDDGASNQIDLYRPQINVETYQARLSSSAIAESASFISAMIHRIQRLIVA